MLDSEAGEAPDPPPLHLHEELVDCAIEEATERSGCFTSLRQWRIPRTIHPQSNPSIPIIFYRHY